LLFLLGIVTARGLGAFRNGVYVKLTTLVLVLVSVGSFGLEEAIARFLPETSFMTKKRRSVFVRKLLLIRLISVFALCSLIYISRNSLGAVGLEELRPYWGVAIIMYLSGLAMSNLLAGVFYAQLQTRLIFAVRTTIAALNIVGAYIFLRLGYGISELMVMMGALLLAATIVYLAGLRESLSQSPEAFKYTRIWKYSLVLWPLTLLNQVLGKQSDVLILSYFSVNPAQIGYYNIAYGLVGTIKTLFISGLGQVAIPIVVEANEQGAARLAQIWELLIKTTTVLSLPFLFFAVLFARPIISTIYSSDYLDSVFYLQLLGLFGLIERLLGGGASYSVLCALGKERVVLVLRAVIGIANLALNVFLVRALGTLGVVIGTGFFNAMIILFEMLVLSRYLALEYPWRFMLRTLLSMVAGGAFTFSVIRIIIPTPSFVQLVLAGALYCGAVGFAMYLLKPFDKVDADTISLVNARLGNLANVLSVRQ